MIPLYDESYPSSETPFVTIGLIILNVLSFVFLVFAANPDSLIYEHGLIPAQVKQGKALFTFITSMFLHGSLGHLIGNMWFLWLFGDNIENHLGHFKFLVFYLSLGVMSELAHILFVSAGQMNLPIIGASGAVSGLLGSYIYLFPENKIRAFMIFIFRPMFFSIPAFVYIGIWFIYQLLYAGTPSVIAYSAHIGGFITGLGITYLQNRTRKKSYPR